MRRTLAKLALVALLVDYIIATTAVAGILLETGAPWWDETAVWALVLSHPLAALFLLIAVHGESLFRRYPYVLLILAPVLAFAALSPAGGYDLANLYAAAPLSWYLVLCLALPLGETTAAWVRSIARKSELFLLLAGAIVLVLAGPVYAFELQAVGFAEGAGSNPGTPVAGALFVLALVLANPLRMPAVRGRLGRDPNFPGGKVFLIDEVRSKGSSHFVSTALAAGRPALEIARGPAPTGPPGPGLRGVATMGPAGLPGSIVLATASEFLAHHPGGLVYLRDLSYLVVLVGHRAAADAVIALRRTVAGTSGTIVGSLALLTPEERQKFAALPGIEVVRLPDPAVEFQAILARDLAGTAGQILRSFATRERRRVEDLSYEDLPAIQEFLRDTFEQLAHAPGDKVLSANWRRTVDRARLDLDEFAGRTLMETATGPWPSTSKAVSSGDLVITASDYWKGRELEESVIAVPATRDRDRVAEAVRTAFVQVLGRTGDHLFEAELKRLGKSPASLGAEDIPQLAQASEEAIVSLGSALDIAAGRADMEEKGRRLKSLLTGIAREAGHGA